MHPGTTNQHIIDEDVHGIGLNEGGHDQFQDTVCLKFELEFYSYSIELNYIFKLKN